MSSVKEKRKREKKGREPYLSMSLPAPLMEEIENIVKELGYWPTKTAFIRESCLEKLEKHRKELEARRACEAERQRLS